MRRREWIVFAVIALGAMLYTLDPVYRLRMRVSFHDPVHLDPVIIAIYTLVGLGGVAVLVTGQRWTMVPRAMLWAFGSFVAWSVISTAWSIDAGETIRQSLFVGAALAAGCAAAVLMPVRRLGWAIWSGVHGVLAWSFLIVARSGANAIDGNGDATGAFGNRNALAFHAALGVVFAAILAADAGRRAWRTRERWWIAGAVIALGSIPFDLWLLGRTNSATPVVALLCVVVALVLLALARRLRARWTAGRSPRARARITERIVLTGGISALVLAVVGWASRDLWLDRVGRDSDLTGRAEIWDTALDWVGDRPLHGQGYLGAWADMELAVEAQQAASLSRPVSSAHNSFVDALLGGGLVGLVAFTVSVALIYLAVTRLAITTRRTVNLLPFAAFMLVLVENLAETFVVGNHLVVAVFAVTGVAATIASSEEADRISDGREKNGDRPLKTEASGASSP